MGVNKNMLKSERVYRGLKQEDMAILIGCSIPAYNQKENGKRAFSVEEITIISSYFNLSGEKIRTIFFDN